MNNYYELIYLTQELKETIIGYNLERAITPHKDVLEVYVSEQDYGNRLVFSSRADETALFLDSHRPPKKRNVVDFFESVLEQQITNVKMAEGDRLLHVNLSSGDWLQFKLFSSRPNAFLVDHERGEIKDAFKDPEKHVGEQPLEPFQPEVEEWPNPDAKPKNQVLRLNPLLPRNLVPALIREYKVEEMSPREVKEFVEYITDQLLENPHPRVLETGEVCLWSREVLSIETEKAFDSVNEAILYAYRNTVHRRRLAQKKEGLREELDRVHRKLADHRDQLEQAERRLQQADKYEKMGHVLMAHAHEKIAGGTDEIELPDPYRENEEITIPLKENKSLADNAQRYYEKAKDARKSYKEPKNRLVEVEKKLNLTKKLEKEFEAVDNLPDFEQWMKDNGDHLEQIGVGEDPEEQFRSPFRKYKVGKHEVWIGKSAKSNDELLSRAHKEDVWLHARGVPGSHALIRMGNRKDYPPQEVILKAASYAAHFSKARGTETAPVMYTKRKYIGKSKGAPPGQVTVKFENVVMVPPHKPKHTNL